MALTRRRSIARLEAQSQRTVSLPISAFRLDFQPHENLLEETVQELMVCLKGGETLPPVSARFDGTNYFLEDGFHRLEAMKRLNKRRIKAIVRPGTLDDMEAEHREYLRDVKEDLKKARRDLRRNGSALPPFPKVNSG